MLIITIFEDTYLYQTQVVPFQYPTVEALNLSILGEIAPKTVRFYDF
jgi:hypothetical protein